ncbi:hypothetical protein ZWY2020_003098 [Hordeum vulgare]|nr:hypothetical protein ZWY2020_003098 [Hordeum vulgare]
MADELKVMRRTADVILADGDPDSLFVNVGDSLQEDVGIMKNMGSDAYRLSISWSRIFPDGTGKVNQEGVDYYNRLIDYMLQQCIIPYTNLYHYDLPLPVHQQYLGWLSPKIIRGGSDTPDEELGEVLPEALQLGQTLVR